MAQLFANNAFSTLAAGISAGDASITLATGTGSRFPALSGSDVFDITLTQAGDETSWEVVRCTARTGDVLTVTRGVEGAAAAWSAGSKVEIRITAAWLNAATPLAGFRNILINSGFQINQRDYVSGAVLAAGSYGHDRWKAGASGGDYTFTQLTSATQITIASGKSLIQVIEDCNVEGGSYILSWTGTAKARIGLNSATPSGAYAASPILITGQTAGTVASVEFANDGSGGTLLLPQDELGSVVSKAEIRPLGFELSLCQRYLPSFSTTAAGVPICAGYTSATTTAVGVFPFATTPRVAPTGVTTSVASSFNFSNSGTFVASAISFGSASTLSATFVLTVSGATATQGGRIAAATAAAKLRFTGCEL